MYILMEAAEKASRDLVKKSDDIWFVMEEKHPYR
jgi:hypothetical protein